VPEFFKNNLTDRAMSITGIYPKSTTWTLVTGSTMRLSTFGVTMCTRAPFFSSHNAHSVSTAQATSSRMGCPNRIFWCALYVAVLHSHLFSSLLFTSRPSLASVLFTSLHTASLAPPSSLRTEHIDNFTLITPLTDPPHTHPHPHPPTFAGAPHV
jgi:hypothetical protein